MTRLRLPLLAFSLGLVACRHVDPKELALRLDEIATVCSEAKTPGPRSAEQVARIDSQRVVLVGFVKRLAE